MAAQIRDNGLCASRAYVQTRRRLGTSPWAFRFGPLSDSVQPSWPWRWSPLPEWPRPLQKRHCMLLPSAPTPRRRIHPHRRDL